MKGFVNDKRSSLMNKIQEDQMNAMLESTRAKTNPSAGKQAKPVKEQQLQVPPSSSTYVSRMSKRLVKAKDYFDAQEKEDNIINNQVLRQSIAQIIRKTIHEEHQNIRLSDLQEGLRNSIVTKMSNMLVKRRDT